MSPTSEREGLDEMSSQLSFLRPVAILENGIDAGRLLACFVTLNAFEN